MTVLELRFPAGRYHATPWGRHVNEGAVEWPPSPWRIVRALIATWYLKARKDEEIPEHTIRALADALSQPPVFRLPRATTAHTRHCMPYNEGKNEKTTKVFDTFVQLSERATGFPGLGDDGKPRTDHCHVHIFCEAHGSCDAITHITIWAPMGFDEAACLALRRLNKVWGHGGHDIGLGSYGIGQPGDFKDSALFGKARVWRSLTPFVSTRHTKTFHDGRPKMDASGWQVGSGAHDLLRLLALHPQGTAATIKQYDERERPFQFGSRRLRSLQFQTIRHDGGGNRGNSSGNAFTITFPIPVSGPLALGYGSHFGLGLFVPVSDAT